MQYFLCENFSAEKEVCELFCYKSLIFNKLKRWILVTVTIWRLNYFLKHLPLHYQAVLIIKYVVRRLSIECLFSLLPIYQFVTINTYNLGVTIFNRFFQSNYHRYFQPKSSDKIHPIIWVQNYK